MVDTVRTWPYLLTSEFQDGQAAGSIHPQQMRDLIVSIPYDLGFGNYTDTGFPAVLRGTVNVNAWPGVTVGTGQTLTVRQNNATNFQAASDYAATNNKFLEFAPGTVEIDNTAGITWSDVTKYNPFTYRGSMESKLIQFHANAPGLTIGDVSATGANQIQNMSIDGMLIDYGATQAGNTAATLLTLGRIWGSSFKNLQIGTSSFNPYNGLRIWTADSTNGQFFFSNSVDNVIIQGAQNRLFSFESSGSGNSFRNLYMNNANGAAAGTITLPFYYGGPIGNSENVFDQCNVEWCATNTVMHFIQGCAVFDGLHMEACSLTGASPYAMYLEGGAHILLDHPTIQNLDVTSANFTGTARFAGLWSEDTLTMIQPWFTWATPPNATLVIGFQDTGNTPVAPRGTFSMTDARFDGADGFIDLDPTLPHATYGNVRHISGYMLGKIFPRAKASTVTNPATNFVLAGAMGSEVIVTYDAPIGANRVLVLGGKMMNGTDKGNTLPRPAGDQVFVLRDSGATGATTITVKDSTTGGTTVGTFASGSAGTSQTFGWSGTAWAAI